MNMFIIVALYAMLFIAAACAVGLKFKCDQQEDRIQSLTRLVISQEGTINDMFNTVKAYEEKAKGSSDDRQASSGSYGGQ